MNALRSATTNRHNAHQLLRIARHRVERWFHPSEAEILRQRAALWRAAGLVPATARCERRWQEPRV